MASTRQVNGFAYRITSTPEEVVPMLIAWGSGFKDVQVSVVGPVVTWTYKEVPTPAIVFAVILFPIGLLFLLVKSTFTFTAVTSPIPGGSQVVFSGAAPPVLINRLAQLMATAVSLEA